MGLNVVQEPPPDGKSFWFVGAGRKSSFKAGRSNRHGFEKKSTPYNEGVFSGHRCLLARESAGNDPTQDHQAHELPEANCLESGQINQQEVPEELTDSGDYRENRKDEHDIGDESYSAVASTAK